MKIYDNTKSKSEDKCFIITAIYGTPLADEVDVFRKYRDQTLLKNTVGRILTAKYYKTSPFFAKVIKNSKLMKLLIQKLIIENLLIIFKKKS